MIETLIDAVADTLAEIKAEALLNALFGTVAEVEAETLYKTLSDIKAETLVEVLYHSPAKDKGRNSCLYNEQSKKQRRCSTRWLTC